MINQLLIEDNTNPLFEYYLRKSYECDNAEEKARYLAAADKIKMKRLGKENRPNGVR